LKITVENSQPYAVLEQTENKQSTAIIVTHYPEWKEVNRDLLECKFEVIFVVDRSGSMTSVWKETVSTLDVLLHALPQQCMFNIVGFGSIYQKLFPKSMIYDDQNMKKALDHCGKMEADLGGTKLYEPLDFILKLPINPSYPRIVIVLTDGEVSNRETVLSLVENYRKETKLFSIGIGRADKELVEGLARAGDGIHTFVANAGTLQSQVLALFQSAFEPSLKDVSLSFSDDSIKFIQTPKAITVTNSKRMTVFALIEGDQSHLKDIIVNGTDPEGNALSWTVPIVMNSKGDLIQKLGAASLIRELEDNSTEITPEIKKEIIRISVENQIISKYTSFIGSHERDTPNTGAMKQQNVSVANSFRDESKLKTTTLKYSAEKYTARKRQFGGPLGFRGGRSGGDRSFESKGKSRGRGGIGAKLQHDSSNMPQRRHSRSRSPERNKKLLEFDRGISHRFAVAGLESRDYGDRRSGGNGDARDQRDKERYDRSRGDNSTDRNKRKQEQTEWMDEESGLVPITYGSYTERERERDRDRDDRYSSDRNKKKQEQTEWAENMDEKSEYMQVEKITQYQTTDNSLHEITKQQSASGCWKPSEVEKRFNLNLSDVKLSQIYPSYNFPEKNTDELLATVFIIAFIQSKYQQQEVIWKMVVHKARLFIIKQLTNIFSMQKSEAIICFQKLCQYATELLANKK
jgi:hypothetical protein